MDNTAAKNVIKLFGMSGLQLRAAIDTAGSATGYQLQTGDSDAAYETVLADRFGSSLVQRAEAAANHYQVFFCLEVSIRGLVNDLIADSDGPAWWGRDRVPENVETEVRKRMRRDEETGMTSRSTDPLDFTTFGELNLIIQKNWDLFGGLFSNKRAVERVLSGLNSLRGPIAHCCDLAEDEVTRFELFVRDWLRQMS